MTFLWWSKTLTTRHMWVETQGSIEYWSDNFRNIISTVSEPHIRWWSSYNVNIHECIFSVDILCICHMVGGNIPIENWKVDNRKLKSSGLSSCKSVFKTKIKMWGRKYIFADILNIIIFFTAIWEMQISSGHYHKHTLKTLWDDFF